MRKLLLFFALILSAGMPAIHATDNNDKTNKRGNEGIQNNKNKTDKKQKLNETNLPNYTKKEGDEQPFQKENFVGAFFINNANKENQVTENNISENINYFPIIEEKGSSIIFLDSDTLTKFEENENNKDDVEDKKNESSIKDSDEITTSNNSIENKLANNNDDNSTIQNLFDDTTDNKSENGSTGNAPDNNNKNNELEEFFNFLDKNKISSGTQEKFFQQNQDGFYDQNDDLDSSSKNNFQTKAKENLFIGAWQKILSSTLFEKLMDKKKELSEFLSQLVKDADDNNLPSAEKLAERLYDQIQYTTNDNIYYKDLDEDRKDLNSEESMEDYNNINNKKDEIPEESDDDSDSSSIYLDPNYVELSMQDTTNNNIDNKYHLDDNRKDLNSKESMEDYNNINNKKDKIPEKSDDDSDSSSIYLDPNNEKNEIAEESNNDLELSFDKNEEQDKNLIIANKAKQNLYNKAWILIENDSRFNNLSEKFNKKFTDRLLHSVENADSNDLPSAENLISYIYNQINNEHRNDEHNEDSEEEEEEEAVDNPIVEEKNHYGGRRDKGAPVSTPKVLPWYKPCIRYAPHAGIFVATATIATATYYYREPIKNRLMTFKKRILNWLYQ